MRIFITLLLVSVFILAVPIAEGRQYNLDYLLDLVESENDEGVKGVFLGGSAQRTVNYLLKKEGGFLDIMTKNLARHMVRASNQIVIEIAGTVNIDWL